MTIDIQTVHFDADGKLIEYCQRKLAKLSIYESRIIEVSVFLKLDNVVHSIKDKVAEIRIHVPKHKFFVKTTTKSFEESFDGAFESILTQIKKNKERMAA